MKIKYSEIISRVKALEKIGNYHLPVTIANAVIRNRRVLRPIVSDFETQKQDIAKRYAKRDENGKYILDTESGQAKFTFDSDKDMISFIQEIESLESIEEDVPIVKFSFSEFEKCERDQRFDIPSLEDIDNIEWMIDYGEDKS